MRLGQGAMNILSSKDWLNKRLLVGMDVHSKVAQKAETFEEYKQLKKDLQMRKRMEHIC